MNYKYQVDVLKLHEVHELPNAWNKATLLCLLDSIEYEDATSILDEELKDMATLALSKLEPAEAAKVVLELRLGDLLTAGQRQNLAEDLKGDRLWEEHAEISFHEELFNVGCILNWAFPNEFPLPDAVMIELKVTSLNSESAENLKNMTSSFIARLLNDGMNENNTIYRLFDENIASNSFTDAEHAIWKFIEENLPETDHSKTLTIYTSWNWVDELKGVKNFESTAFPDGQYHK